MTFDGDPEHPIIDNPWTWDLIEFSYHHKKSRGQQSYIDMLLERSGKRRRLRFYSPRELELRKGLPNTFGMCILDVSSRQLDGLSVRVADFEDRGMSPQFWAARVIDVDKE